MLRARCQCPRRGLGRSEGPSSMRSTCSWRRLVRAWPLSKRSIPLGSWMWVLGCGYSTDDHCFYPDAPGLGPISDRVRELHYASQLVIRGAEGEHDWTIFVVAGRAAAVVADRHIRIRWDAEIRRATEGLETLPGLIALPRDEQGRPIIPRTQVTALVELSKHGNRSWARLTRSRPPLSRASW